MTNNEYEKACVESATGESEIAWIYTHIEHHLRQVDNLMERRRELISRFNMNKGCAISDDFDGDYRNGDFYEGAE
ncbi:hypothetical protein [Escherichia coli]|uniref:hypothetical protein n=1 Tax=Escherichia coli TaxID=562 RepID=UPI003AFA16A6